MKVILCENASEVINSVSNEVLKEIINNPQIVLGLSSGNIDEQIYNTLAKKCKEKSVSLKDATVFGISEYYPIDEKNDLSCNHIIINSFINNTDISKGNTYFFNGYTNDPDIECREFDDKIKECGGFDLLISNIGDNGEIGFNEPSDILHSNSHLTTLNDYTKHFDKNSFSSSALIPKAGLTVGFESIQNSKKIILFAIGKEKNYVVNYLNNDRIKTDIPVTLLKPKDNIVLICDKEAYI